MCTLLYHVGKVRGNTNNPLFCLSPVQPPKSMYPIDPFCANICPGTSSANYGSILTHAELLVCLAVLLCISLVLNRQKPLPLITISIYDECIVLHSNN